MAFGRVNVGGISTSDKQSLIKIVNDAEKNESTLRDQFVTAVNEVDTEGGINLPTTSTWAEILANLPKIKTGKKWADGSTTVGANNNVTVTGLGFTPSIIIIESSNEIYRKVYRSGESRGLNNIVYLYNTNTPTDFDGWTISEDGFSTNFYGSVGYALNWWAFE